MKLDICHLYPDILNLYGDQGNIICMRERLRQRGIEAEITELGIGERADFSQFDLFFIGGGQDFEQGLLLDDLNSGKAREIRSAAEDGKVFLAICGGFQMLGQYYKTWNGSQHDFVGVLDMHTVGARERMTGNYIFECPPENGGATVVGFENHSGKTYLGANISPLGVVTCGHGNNGEDGAEGARYKNVFGTYSHGPLLPKNPQLADFILTLALERKYPDVELGPLDDSLEDRARRNMEQRIRGEALRNKR